jgi:hypothetical protein
MSALVGGSSLAARHDELGHVGRAKLPLSSSMHDKVLFVVLSPDAASSAGELTAMLYRATRECTSLHWRLHDLVLVPVPSLEGAGR